MESQTEKAFYERHLKKVNNQSPQYIQGIQAMKKSNDSLYKQLRFTPHDETEDKIEQSDSNIVETKNDNLSSNLIDINNIFKENLSNKFQQSSSNRKNKNKSQFTEFNKVKKVIKPSTPTFHAKSSLNFLKHRKTQLLMNQAMGITFDNLQLIRKSKSKSKQQNNSIKKQFGGNKKTLNILSSKLNVDNLDKLKKTYENKSVSKFVRVQSTSQLNKIEQILGFNNENKQFDSSQRSFLYRSRIRNNSVQNGYRSHTNSLNSSRSRSIQSKNSEENSLRSSRRMILNNIRQKLSESKFLKNIDRNKDRKMSKQVKMVQNRLQGRLNNLQMILMQLQNKKSKQEQMKINKYGCNKQGQQNKKGYELIYKLKKQIDELNKQLNQLQRNPINSIKSINPIIKNNIVIPINSINPINHINSIKRNNNVINNKINKDQILPIKKQQSKIVSQSYLINKFQLNSNNNYQKQQQYQNNNLIYKSQNRINQHINYPHISIYQQPPVINKSFDIKKQSSQPKILFQYDNTHNINHSNNQSNNHSNNQLNSQYIHNKSYQNQINPFNYQQIQSNNNSLNYYPNHQLYANHQTISVNPSFNSVQFHNASKFEFIPSNYPNISNKNNNQNNIIQNQKVSNKIYYEQNKSLSLKNKHNIQAKRFSPIKNIKSNFISTQNQPRYF